VLQRHIFCTVIHTRLSIRNLLIVIAILTAMFEVTENESWSTSTVAPVSDGCKPLQTTLYVAAMLAVCLPGLIGNAVSAVVLGRDSRAAPVATFLLRSLAVADSFFLAIWTVHYPIRWIVIGIGSDAIQKSYWWILFRVCTFPLIFIGQTLTIWLMLVISVNRFLVIRSSPRLDVQLDESTATAPSRLTTYQVVVAAVTLGAIAYNLPRFFELAIVDDGEKHFKSSLVNGSSASDFTWIRTWLGQHSVYKSVYIDYMYYAFTFVLPLVILVSMNAYVVAVYRAALGRHRQLELVSPLSETCRHSAAVHFQPKSSSVSIRPVAATTTAVIACCGCGATSAAAAGVRRTRVLIRHEMKIAPSGCTRAAGSPDHVVVCNLSTSSVSCCACIDCIFDEFGNESPARETRVNGIEDCPQHPVVDIPTVYSASTEDVVFEPSGEEQPVKTEYRTFVSAPSGRRVARGRALRRSMSAAERDVTVAMGAVVVVFVACQFPARAVQLASKYQYDDCRTSVSFYLIHISNVLEILNSAVNFIIYCVLYRRFRLSLVDWLVSCCGMSRSDSEHKGVDDTGQRIRGRKDPLDPTEELELREMRGTETQLARAEVVTDSVTSHCSRRRHSNDVQTQRGTDDADDPIGCIVSVI